MEQLKRNYNMDTLMQLAVTVLCVPIVDVYKSLECIKKVQAIDCLNRDAILLECCIHYYHLAGITDELYDRLKSIKNESKEELSITKYVMSWYYRNDIEKALLRLYESIELCDKYVVNYEALGNIYLEKGDKQLGRVFFEKAFDNIQKVSYENAYNDFTDLDEYFDEYLRGFNISFVAKETIERHLMQCYK